MKKLPEIKFHKTRKDYYLYLDRKYHYLGKTLEEAERRRRVLLAGVLLEEASTGHANVSDLCAAFLESHQDSRSIVNYRIACRYLVRVHGETSIESFGPNALRSVRNEIVASGVSRQYVNKLTGMIRTIFSWGVGHELVPESVAGALKYVRAIDIQKSQSPESKPVKPVSDDVIDATLPELSRTVAAMVRIQRITGMRPSEVFEMRASEIDRSSTPWIYVKEKHKNAWRGQKKRVPLGPQARAILESYLLLSETDGLDYLFSPIRERNERYSRLRASRMSKVQPSQVNRSKTHPKISPGEHYTASSYAQAISRAAKKAGVEHWFPYQIRHTAATKIRERHGIEGSQVLLGHATIDATQIYAERNMAEAVRIAEMEG